MGKLYELGNDRNDIITFIRYYLVYYPLQWFNRTGHFYSLNKANKSEEIRRVIYTTNAIESLNMTLRKVLKKKHFFPSEDAASFKQLFLAIRNISKRWTMPVRNWGEAMSRFRIEFGERLSNHIN